MLGIGFAEMLVIAAIALVVIGPEKFPDFAKIVVRTIRDLRGYVDDMKHEISEELKPIKREVESVNKFTRYDSESYLRSLTEDKPKPPQTSGQAAETAPEPGDFGYDESQDAPANDAGPVAYGSYPGGEADTPPIHEQEGAAPPDPAPLDPARAAPPASDDPPHPDEFDDVRQPERLD